MDANGDQNNFDKKPVCKYGTKCYRKHPEHLRNYKHPPKRTLVDANSPGAKRARGEDLSSEDVHFDESTATPRTSCSVEEAADRQPASTERTNVCEAQETSTGATGDESSVNQLEESESEAGSVLLPDSPVSNKGNIKQKFLVEMPEDFYSFLKFCQSLDSKNPEDCDVRTSLSTIPDALSSCGLRLAGPFLLVLGRIKPKRRTQDFYLTYCRYYYDPPEVQTVLCGDNETGDHIAYFRDDPSELPVQVVANCAEKDANFSVLGDNLFAAVHRRVCSLLAECDAPPPEALARLRDALKTWAGRADLSLEPLTAAMRSRKRRVLGRTLQGLGVVVPYQKDTEVGYRPLPESHASLRKMLRRIVEADTEAGRSAALDQLQEVVTLVQFANDEGDPGMGLELGLDVFSWGGEVLHSTVKHLLLVAYELLNRPVSTRILTAHLANRRRGPPVL